jgi:hypothetical protein
MNEPPEEDIQWLDLAPDSGTDVEDLTVGTGRHRAAPTRPSTTRSGRMLRYAAGCTLVTALGVAAIVHTRSADHQDAMPERSNARTSETPVARAVGLSPFDRILAMVRAPHLTGAIRQSSPGTPCAAVAVGSSPEHSALRAVRAVAPGTRLRDSSRTLDQFAGLCAVLIRFSAPGAVTITIASSAPDSTAHGPLDNVEVGIQTVDGITTSYAEQHWHNGWTVLVGASGNQSRLPGSRELSALVADRRLLW